MIELNAYGGPNPPPIRDFAGRIDSPTQAPVRDFAESEPQRFQENDSVEISFLPPTESGEQEQQAAQVPRLDITV